MKILIGFIMVLVALRMRYWGRKKYFVNDTLKPLYQTNLFWFLFSLIGIAVFVSGLILFVIGVTANL